MKQYDLAVIGEGISGLACAGGAAKAGLSVVSFESNVLGGLVININALQGYAAGRPGFELASEMSEANAAAGVASMGCGVSALQRRGPLIELTTDTGSIQARAVVLATGARMRELSVPGESDFEHRGVSHCADCDGPMLNGRPALVVGGGDSAYMQAAVLTSFASEVTLLLRSGTPRARPELIEAVSADDRIRVVSNTTILEICGDDEVTGARVASAGTEMLIPCAGVFVYAGLQPNAELVREQVVCAADGAIETDASYRTSLEGVHAIGAVRAGYSGLLSDAVREATEVAQRIVGRLKS